MIVLEKEKLVFVEVPRTGSEAIRQELMSHYGGISIGSKHSINIPEQYCSFKVFYGSSNPVDRTFSKYKKYKSRPSSYFLHEGKWWLVKYIAWVYNMVPFIAIRLFNLSFDQYLLFFFPLPFVDPSNFIPAENVIGVVRKEFLNEDFKRVMRECSVEVKRDIPVINKTEKKKSPFVNYNVDSGQINWAFGIELERLGYGKQAIDSTFVVLLNRVAYKCSSVYKGLIWKLTRG